MSVVRSGAPGVLWQRIFGAAAPDEVVHHDHHLDPRGFLDGTGAARSDPDEWLWSATGDAVPALADPAAYDLTVGNPLSVEQIHLSPAAAATLDTTTFDAYCRASADVIMRGGTASGVVYPLALCEMARRVRLRSLGGASAGAIAAALGAAAELGRARLDRAGAGVEAGGRPTGGRFRQGYPGLADVGAWLAELDPALPPGTSPAGQVGSGDPDPQYRVAGLFQPAPATRPLFRIVVALLRRHYRAAAALVPFAAGRVPTAAAAVVVLASVFALALTSAPTLPDGWTAVGSAAALLATVSLLATGTALVGMVARRLLGPALLLVGAACAVAITVALADGGTDLVGIARLWAAAVGTWVVGALIVVVVLVVPLVRIFARLRDFRYGLVAGADEPPGPGLGARLDALAGLPPSRPVVTWLRRALDDLAGQADRDVLRFGHLWFGDDYVPPEQRRGDDKERLAMYAAALDSPASRLVNLQLMTSEITQGLAYEMPLRRGEELFYSPDELGRASPRSGRIFSEEVLDALGAGTVDIDAEISGREGIRLKALPRPWDLPVVVAVRLSMALPVLFQAVPLYRRVVERPLEDDFGRPLAADPSPAHAVRPRVERLWFSDGGLTSNFPIHFFDSLLPRWPTLGINLASQPSARPGPGGVPDVAVQDVDLPSDGSPTVARSRSTGRGLVEFMTALFSTSRNWRDTEMALLPAYTGRLATVRLGAGEGDVNLFMTPQVVASLALRGVVAGARLRRRWTYDPIWRRHQWLRMRGSATAVDGVLDISARTGLPTYDAVSQTPVTAVQEIYARQRQGDPLPYRAAEDEAARAVEVAATWGAVAAARTGRGPEPDAPTTTPDDQPRVIVPTPTVG